jgi:hypothetical protein
LRGTSFGPPKELPLDLNRDLIQPLFSPLRSLLLVPGMGLKLSYPIFSGAKLGRSLARHFYSLLAIYLGISSGPVKHPQNSLGCPVKWIASFGLGVRFWRKRNDCLSCTGSAITHRTAPYVSGNAGKLNIFRTLKQFRACG